MEERVTEVNKETASNINITYSIQSIGIVSWFNLHGSMIITICLSQHCFSVGTIVVVTVVGSVCSSIPRRVVGIIVVVGATVIIVFVFV